MSHLYDNSLMENINLLQPLEFLKSDVKVVLLLLNQPLEPEITLSKLWKNAVLKICCDGGANRLYDANCSSGKCDRYVPDFICGDLDSLREEVKDYFVQQKSQIVVLEDQNWTDFNKSARFAMEHCKSKKIEKSQIVVLEDQNWTDFNKSARFAMEHCKSKKIEYDVIVAFCATGGRLDQTLSNINTLYDISALQKKPCYLLSSMDVSCLLQPGSTNIATDTSLEGDYCGLIPIGFEATNVTTNGLKYNLDKHKLSFGSLISTSNSLETGTKRIIVNTSHRLLWTLCYDATKMK